MVGQEWCPSPRHSATVSLGWGGTLVPGGRVHCFAIFRINFSVLAEPRPPAHSGRRVPPAHPTNSRVFVASSAFAVGRTRFPVTCWRVTTIIVLMAKRQPRPRDRMYPPGGVVMRSDVVMTRDGTCHRWCEGCPDPMHAIIILGIAKAAYGPGACMCSRHHANGPRQSCCACAVRGHRHTKRSLTAPADSGADLWSSPACTVPGMVPQVKREPGNNGNCHICLCLCVPASASPSCPLCTLWCLLYPFWSP